MEDRRDSALKEIVFLSEFRKGCGGARADEEGNGASQKLLKTMSLKSRQRQTGDGYFKQEDIICKIFMKSHSASSSVPV